MQRERIMTLLARKLAKEITEEELSELETLMQLYPDSLYYEETLRQVHFKKDLESDTEQAFERHLLKYSADFNEISEHEPFPKIRLWPRLAMVAAMVLLVAGFSWYFLAQPGPKLANPDTTITCGNATRKKLMLPDGTSVWLNENSRLEYDQDLFANHNRQVRLFGEAFFDVAKDKKHPFIIYTEKISIKVLGTAFNVKAYPEDNKTEATLLRGMIELSINNEPEQHLILRPSEKFALTQSKTDEFRSALVIEQLKPISISDKIYYEETSWLDNKLIFKDNSFEELMPKLEKWYNIQFKVANPQVRDYHFSGMLDKETIEEALTAMQLIRPFKFRMLANNTVLIY
jgi:transmembrane sensor